MVLFQVVNKIDVLKNLAAPHRTLFLSENAVSYEMLSVLIILENLVEWAALFLPTREIMILYDFSIADRYLARCT